MAPNTSENIPFQSSLNFKGSSEKRWHTPDQWVSYKKEYDGAEGLWRIHNNLYDLTTFINRHPGGKMWLELTKGHDITEAFETHHLSEKPKAILATYLVRPAKTCRNSPFTFEKDGFYSTLKQRILPIVANRSKNNTRFSNVTTDVLCVGAFVFAILAAATWSYLLGCFAGLLLCATSVASHNYLHQRDNFRMYYFDLSCKSFKTWRITHVLSHHLFPNTILDYEMRMVEPYIDFRSKKKTKLEKYGSWVLLVCACFGMATFQLLLRILPILRPKMRTEINWFYYIVPVTLPTMMYLFSGQTGFATFWMWFFIIECEGFLFVVIGLNAGHHHPDIFHDGDSPWPNTNYDWGLHQVDAAAERLFIRKSRVLVLTTFGEHVLHHLFPTLDHNVLKYLHGALLEVLSEFYKDLHVKSQMEIVKGTFLQMSKDIPRGYQDNIQTNNVKQILQ